MFATIRTRLIRTGFALAITTVLLGQVTALADDGTVTITAPTNHQTFKSGAKITVAGTVNAAGASYVIIDPAWSHEFKVSVSGSKFSTSKLSAPKVTKKRTYIIDVNAYDSSGQNIAEGTVAIIVTP
jgi:hypothetical protein